MLLGFLTTLYYTPHSKWFAETQSYLLIFGHYDSVPYMGKFSSCLSFPWFTLLLRTSAHFIVEEIWIKGEGEGRKSTLGHTLNVSLNVVLLTQDSYL